MDMTIEHSWSCQRQAQLHGGAVANVGAQLDRIKLQRLIDLLNRYDLNDASANDTGDLSVQLRAFGPL